MAIPVLNKSIPNQVVNEQAAYGPFDLKPFFVSDEGSIKFRAELTDGNALPKGMICTEDGILTGIPAKNTSGNYEVKLIATNKAGQTETKFVLTIKPSFVGDSVDYIDKIKTQIWQALEQNLPIPDLGTLYEQQVTPLEIYYLLERWGILTIWDAFNLDPPGELHLLHLEGASQHYNVYDRGSCIIAAPKDLYSYERTTLDGLITAQAVAREVYKRNWTIQMAGFEKLTRAVWVELQHLGDQHGRRLEIVNYAPSVDDLKIYNTQAIETKIQSKPE